MRDILFKNFKNDIDVTNHINSEYFSIHQVIKDCCYDISTQKLYCMNDRNLFLKQGGQYNGVINPVNGVYKLIPKTLSNNIKNKDILHHDYVRELYAQMHNFEKNIEALETNFITLETNDYMGFDTITLKATNILKELWFDVCDLSWL